MIESFGPAPFTLNASTETMLRALLHSVSVLWQARETKRASLHGRRSPIVWTSSVEALPSAGKKMGAEPKPDARDPTGG